MSTDKGPVAGWRKFSCSDCGDLRWIASRDCMSPSGDGCTTCGEELRPTDRMADPSLRTDRSGNLVQPPEDKVTTEGVVA